MSAARQKAMQFVRDGGAILLVRKTGFLATCRYCAVHSEYQSKCSLKILPLGLTSEELLSASSPMDLRASVVLRYLLLLAKKRLANSPTLLSYPHVACNCDTLEGVGPAKLLNPRSSQCNSIMRITHSKN